MKKILFAALLVGCGPKVDTEGAVTGKVECGDFAGIYVDTFVFDAEEGDSIHIRTDNVDEDTAFEVQGFVFETEELKIKNLLDDNYTEVTCTFGDYTCIDYTIDVQTTGPHTAGVGPFSSRCNSDPGEYAFWVELNGKPADLTPVEDDLLLDL